MTPREFGVGTTSKLRIRCATQPEIWALFDRPVMRALAAKYGLRRHGPTRPQMAEAKRQLDRSRRRTGGKRGSGRRTRVAPVEVSRKVFDRLRWAVQAGSPRGAASLDERVAAVTIAVRRHFRTLTVEEARHRQFLIANGYPAPPPDDRLDPGDQDAALIRRWLVRGAGPSAIARAVLGGRAGVSPRKITVLPPV